MLSLTLTAIAAPAQEAPPGAEAGQAPGQARQGEKAQHLAWDKGLWDSLGRRTGKVELPGVAVTLTGPDSFYFLDPSDAKKAREVQFGDQSSHTLNCGIRVLGRSGVLVLNFVADMDQKDLIAGELDKVLSLAESDPGSRYEDFSPGVDKVAAYGIGAFCAPGSGVGGCPDPVRFALRADACQRFLRERRNAAVADSQGLQSRRRRTEAMGRSGSRRYRPRR